ncbi:DNA methylase N-4/N-6 domain-containing protein [Thiomonas sp. X19]|uniref:site-specific DNA-methyltransferase n=1 Tax=Thiomonas sp. X19 TaxID=1050370 RepID=UPI000B74E3BD|nr:site-specific DNA-methyltransferase [Thiomonas sp. X19]SCC94911.1 DNA methylase N-4/N-6 domain-containing protein [Thiomonas sp. X19]
MANKPKAPLGVETLTHLEATRKNIPTAEYQSVMQKDEQSPVRVAYARRNRDLDPQLVWRGKDEQDWSDLVVHASPLYIQEKVHPKVLIDDLKRQSERAEAGKAATQAGFTTDLFADFNGLPDDNAKTEFYQHDAHWANRMILSDSLQVMASLAEREGLRGQVQCIYFDPPYGIKFNSNFQWSTTSRDVKDGSSGHITREPEQVKAFRDTWRDGIHSYLTYLRDRLTVARDLLTESGSIFVQIGDENVHRVRTVMDEVFGDENFVSQIIFEKTSSTSTDGLASISDHILWFAKRRDTLKFRPSYRLKVLGEAGTTQYTWFDEGGGFDRRLGASEIESDASEIDRNRIFACDNLTSQRPAQGTDVTSFAYNGSTFTPGKGTFKTDARGLTQLAKAGRLRPIGKSLMYRRFLSDFPVVPIANYWNDVKMTGFSEDKTYIVQTGQKVIERCLLMVTDPGDLVLDPTCGSGTTAYVAEQWGRRWITLDTSRVALALARARIMGARYPYYLLADSREGQLKDAEVTRTAPSSQTTRGNLRHGFVYERVPHITLKSIANNAEIDVIWDKWQKKLEPLREQLNRALRKQWQDWEIPRDISDIIGKEGAFQKTVFDLAPSEIRRIHERWWDARIARQKEIDGSIAAKAEFEFLYDKPYEDKRKVRVAGPFTVESLSPHRVLGVDENDELIDGAAEPKAGYGDERNFVQIILENLKAAGVQQAHKDDKINFTALTPWPGELVCAEGRYFEGGGESGTEKRAAIFIGPEFGTVSRPDLVAAAREAGDADFDVLIACAFNYDAHSAEFDKLGRIPVLKARMNADLHMADDLKNTGKGNLFVIFGEPDIDILDAEDGQVRVKVNGVDVFKPNTGTVESSNTDEIACWFIDTDYNEESFFVRQAYFLGQNDPYKSLKTTLKAEINPEAWATLNSDTSRPFDKPKSGRIAVKVINHLGDEVMKVFKVEGKTS